MNTLFKRCVALFILAVLLLSLTLSVTSCIALLAPTPDAPGSDEPDADIPATVLPKQQIMDNMEAFNTSRVFEYSCDYLSDWGISNIDRDLFKWVEYTVATYYVEVLPSAYDLAVKACEHFLTNGYDTVDLSSKEALTNALISSYITCIDDKYAIYRTADEYEAYTTDMSGSFGGIGVTVEYNYTDNTLLVIGVYRDSAAELAGIKVGDCIYAVNGISIDEVGYDATVNAIRGEIGTQLTITVDRNGEKIDLVATRMLVVEKSVEFTINGNIGYIILSGFKQNTYSQFKEAIDYFLDEEVEGIVFDLRNNPGGYLSSVMNVLSYLVPTGTELVSYQYRGSDVRKHTSLDDHTINVPCTVICNGYTASAGELFTAAMRDYNDMGILDVTVVGTTTYGKGIMQNSYIHKNKSSLTLTVAYYNPPSGVNYHGIGIVPDVTVEATDGDDDAQYDAAIEELLKLIAAEADSAN